MTTSEMALVDANVLVYAHDVSSLYHVDSLRLIDKGRRGDIPLCVTPQVLSEFYATVTDPKRVAPAHSIEKAQEAIIALYRSKHIRTIYFTPAAMNHLLLLIERYRVTRQNIFDLQLAAIMLANNINRIYTYDVSGFNLYNEIQCLPL